MSGFSAPIGVSPALLAPTAQATTADLARGKAKDAAQKFESQFLSIMLQQMFEGVKTDGPFGGVLGGEGHQVSPCIFRISRWIVSARPMPPAFVICLPIASVISERNISSPSPPPKGPSVFTPSNICWSMIDRN